MKGGFWLSDAQWQLISPHLPYWAAGRRRVDDRRVISGIIHMLQSGCRWQDCPEECGPTAIYNRYNRWSQKGHWQHMFAELTAVLAGTLDEISIDTTYVKAHRCAGGGKGGLRFVSRVGMRFSVVSFGAAKRAWRSVSPRELLVGLTALESGPIGGKWDSGR